MLVVFPGENFPACLPVIPRLLSLLGTSKAAPFAGLGVLDGVSGFPNVPVEFPGLSVALFRESTPLA